MAEAVSMLAEGGVMLSLVMLAFGIVGSSHPSRRKAGERIVGLALLILLACVFALLFLEFLA